MFAPHGRQMVLNECYGAVSLLLIVTVTGLTYAAFKLFSWYLHPTAPFSCPLRICTSTGEQYWSPVASTCIRDWNCCDIS